MITLLRVVGEHYRLTFHSRNADYDWLDDALWEALPVATPVVRVLSWFGVGEAVMTDAIARLLLRGVLLIDPSAGAIHRTGTRPAPASYRMPSVDVWQDKRTGVVVAPFDDTGRQLRSGLLEDPPDDVSVVTFADDAAEPRLWSRLFELSDAELYAALPRRQRPPDDRDVTIERERRGALTIYCPVWTAPGRGLAFPSFVPVELRGRWRRCQVAGLTGATDQVLTTSWDDHRQRFRSWRQIVGEWELQVSRWLDKVARGAEHSPGRSVTAAAAAITRVWLDRTRLAAGRFELAELHERIRTASHSVVVRWASHSERRNLLESIPPGLEVVVYHPQEDAPSIADDRPSSWHLIGLDKPSLARLPRCFVLIDVVDLWRVGEAVRNWPDNQRGRSYLRLRSRRALDKLAEALRELPGEVEMLSQPAPDETDVASDRIVEAAEGFASRATAARRDAEALSTDDSQGRPDRQEPSWSSVYLEDLRRMANALRPLGAPETVSSGWQRVDQRPPLSIEYVPAFEAVEMLDAARTQPGRLHVERLDVPAEGEVGDVQPTTGKQAGPAQVWRITEGAVFRYLLGERDGILPWIVVTLDAGAVHATLAAELIGL
jgi:hypothetical protein